MLSYHEMAQLSAARLDQTIAKCGGRGSLPAHIIHALLARPSIGHKYSGSLIDVPGFTSVLSIRVHQDRFQLDCQIDMLQFVSAT